MTIAYLEAKQDELDLDKINMMIQFIEDCDTLQEAAPPAPTGTPELPAPVGAPSLPVEPEMPGGSLLPGPPMPEMAAPPASPLPV